MVRDISLVFNFSNPVLQFGYDMDLHTLISNVTNYECKIHLLTFIKNLECLHLNFLSILFLNKSESASISIDKQQKKCIIENN